MATVTYPYHVRHNGRDYKPGEPIELDAAKDDLRGEVNAEETEKAAQPAKRRRTAKPKE